jgi:DNA-binding HxlR family transcriptional regulator
MAKVEIEIAKSECLAIMLPIKDALQILSGKWKLPIIVSLSFGSKRFTQISKEIAGITDKVLSKELKELEENKLITRTVYNSVPPAVEYEITPHGLALERVIMELKNWGIQHRKNIIGK